MEELERTGAVEVVGVAYREGARVALGGDEHRLRGSPRLPPVGRGTEAPGQVVQGLGHEVDGSVVSERASDMASDLLLDLFPDHERGVTEPGPERVEDVIVHDRFALGAEGLQLLQTPVSRREAGGEDDEG